MLDGESTRAEYGVIVDRTSDGLGFYLAWTGPTLEKALTFVYDYDSRYPVEIRVRRVHVGAWRELAKEDADG